MNALNRVWVTYWNPADHHSARFTIADKGFAKKIDFKDIKFPVKIWDIHKFGKKNFSGIIVFAYENKEKHPIYVSKKCSEEKHFFDLLLIVKEEKRHHVLMKDFNTFMYDHVWSYFTLWKKTFFSLFFNKLTLQKKY